jgi:hypothetical protein
LEEGTVANYKLQISAISWKYWKYHEMPPSGELASDPESNTGLPKYEIGLLPLNHGVRCKAAQCQLRRADEFEADGRGLAMLRRFSVAIR